MSISQAAERLPDAAFAMTGTALAVTVDGNWQVASGWLDPAEPFLADHQPGGSPLLGTVGGLEVLASWIAAVHGRSEIVALEAVEAIHPVVLENKAPHRVTVRWRADGPGRKAAELLTPDDGGEVHIRCMFVTGDGETARAHARPQLQPNAIDAAEIYRVFFHGPTFRVVSRAELQGGTMVSELAAPLPRWSTAPDPLHIAPRLIEFGLQTAGLLQLALDGAMMIPRYIARIDRFRPTDVDHAAPLFAVAKRAGRDPADPIDVRIVDADGAVHLAVTGYQCAPLPFPTDDVRLTALAERLRATATGTHL